MKAVKTFAIGAAGIAALFVGAAPAAAQYPGYGYGGYQNGYPTNVIGQVLQSILNPYGQFGYNQGVNPQTAVNQCAAAVNQRLQRQYGYGGYGAGYGGYAGGYSPYGYGNGYGNGYAGGQVLGISRVEQRSASVLRVRGFATSGMAYGEYPYGGYGGGYGGYNGYNGNAYAAAPADLSFRCDVDYRGYIRDIDIDRRG
jgi:hypothetical protein